MSEFLDKLKSAVENGDFNSEAAKKIIDIDNLATKKTVSKKEALAANAEAEKQLLLKQTDAVNTQLATLIEIEDMVEATIDDMMSFVAELDDKFVDEFKNENPIFGDLSQKIEQIKSKYSSIINN